MIKSKVTHTDIVKFDEQSPVSAVFAGSTGRVFGMTLAMSIDPVEALRVEATSCRVRVLTQRHTSPTVLDDVVERSDIIENIKNINVETTEKYNEFLANDVLAERNFTIASVINLYSEDLAYNYEMRDILTVTRSLPELDVATIKSKTGKKFIRSATQILPDKTFTYSDMEVFFDRPNMPVDLVMFRSLLATFAKQAPFFQKTLSDVMHYPFPVNDTLAMYRDNRACPYAESIQGVGLSYLSDEDFRLPLAVDVDTDVDPFFVLDSKPGGGAGPRGVGGAIDQPDPQDVPVSPFSTLSTAYGYLTAYNDGEPEDIFVSKRQLKRLPFRQKFTVVAKKQVPRNVTVEALLMNKNGVIVSKLTKDVNLIPLMVDSSRPMIPPDVTVGMATGDDQTDSLMVTMVQRDIMANKVQLLVKESTTLPFSDLGVYDLVHSEELTLKILSNEIVELVTVRVVALTNKGRTSSAFSDIVWQAGGGTVSESYDGVPKQSNPQKTTGLIAMARPLIRDDGLFDVTITTAIVSDGIATDPDASSLYGTLFCRRLNVYNGDTPGGVADEGGGTYVTDPTNPAIHLDTSPGGSFVDRGVSVGTYLYVVDAYAGDEAFVNVARSGTVYLDHLTPDKDGFVKDAVDVSYVIQSVDTVIGPKNLDVSIMYDITIPKGKRIDIALLESSVDVVLPDLSVESISLASKAPKLTDNNDGTYILNFCVAHSDMSPAMAIAAQKGALRVSKSQLVVGTFPVVSDAAAGANVDSPLVTASQRKLTPQARKRIMQRRAQRGGTDVEAGDGRGRFESEQATEAAQLEAAAAATAMIIRGGRG